MGQREKVDAPARAGSSLRDKIVLPEETVIRLDPPDRVPATLVPAGTQPSPPPPKVSASRLKRTLDVGLCLAMLTLGAPVFLLVAIAIKLDDRGPVFYRQERWGAGGTMFRLFKFRSMVPDSDARYGIRQSWTDDERVTRVGRVLRKTGLDELPQLLNILRGEMSFVGPRPLALGELVPSLEGGAIAYEEVPGFLERLRARPGLTGLATIHLPKDAHPLLKLEQDLRYIKEWSLRMDLEMIAMSFWISARGRWESRAPKV